MGKFRESRTAKNLLTAFAGESQARNRYTYFARRAREEGFVQIADIFAETADQECEHALRFFKFFNGGELEITGDFPPASSRGLTRTWWPPPTGSASSIARCIRALPQSPVRKDLSGRRTRGRRFRSRKNSTKSAIGNWRPTSCPSGPFPVRRRGHGAAATAATCTPGRRLPKNVRPASNPRDFSSCSAKTGSHPGEWP